MSPTRRLVLQLMPSRSAALLMDLYWLAYFESLRMWLWECIFTIPWLQCLRSLDATHCGGCCNGFAPLIGNGLRKLVRAPPIVHF